MRLRSVSLLACAAVTAALLVPAPAAAHKGLKRGRYECWLSQIAMYSNFDLKIRSGGRYSWIIDDDVKKGNFERDGQKIRFTSGYLKRKNFKGIHDAYTDSFGVHTHVIYLYKGGYDSDNLKYDCNLN